MSSVWKLCEQCLIRYHVRFDTDRNGRLIEERSPCGCPAFMTAPPPPPMRLPEPRELEPEELDPPRRRAAPKHREHAAACGTEPIIQEAIVEEKAPGAPEPRRYNRPRDRDAVISCIKAMEIPAERVGPVVRERVEAELGLILTMPEVYNLVGSARKSASTRVSGSRAGRKPRAQVPTSPAAETAAPASGELVPSAAASAAAGPLADTVGMILDRAEQQLDELRPRSIRRLGWESEEGRVATESQGDGQVRLIADLVLDPATAYAIEDQLRARVFHRKHLTAEHEVARA